MDSDASEEIRRLRAENDTFRKRYVTQTAYDVVKAEVERLRAELAAAQPAQAPVGHVHREGKRADGKPWMAAYFAQDGTNDLPDGTPLYAAPPARQPLTERQLAECMLAVEDPLLWGRLGAGSGDMLRAFARAVEQAQGIGEKP